MKRWFVCADIHGFYDEFIRALQDSGFHTYNHDDSLIVCGDAFDRGPQAQAVYDFLHDMQEHGRLIYIKGNHEDLLFECTEEFDKYGFVSSTHHYSNGTVDTLNQFIHNNKLKEVLNFISKNCVDYYELNNYVFVHGWIPYVFKHEKAQLPFEIKLDIEPKLNAEPFMWKQSRWYNGMKEWRDGVQLPGKTIVCGHWHTSFGNYNYHYEGSGEFESDSNFEPFVDSGIIALDGCTAHTHKVNILMIEEGGGTYVNGNKISLM